MLSHEEHEIMRVPHKLCYFFLVFSDEWPSGHTVIKMSSDNPRTILGDEPGNNGGKQDCMGIRRIGSQIKFIDINCFDRYRFICEAMNSKTTSSKAPGKVEIVSFYIY